MARLKTLWAEFKAFAFKGNMIDLAVAVVIGAAFSGVIDSLVKDIIMPMVSYAVTGVKEAKNAAADAADAASKKIGLTTQPATQPTTQEATPAGAVKGAVQAATRPTTGPAGEAAAAEAATKPSAVAEQMIAASDGKSKEWKEMVSAFATALAADRQAADAKAAQDKAEAEKKAAEAKPVDLSWKIGRINIGNFLASLLNFVIIAFAVFIVIVKLLGGVMKRAGGTPKPSEPTTKECPECLSVIPIKARRCPNCTSSQVPNSTPTV
ncbi:MAG TPA: MscL family protein [Humisphaera sp.]